MYIPKNKQFIKEALETHNQIRVLHQASKLKINNDLTKMAQQWAEHIATTKKFDQSNHWCELKKKNNNNFGIKIFLIRNYSSFFKYFDSINLKFI